MTQRFSHPALVLFLFLALAASACRSSSRAVGASQGGLRELSAKQVLKKASERHIKADWLSAKAKVDVRANGEDQKFTLYLTQQRDAFVWMTLRKLSIEGGQLYVDADSVYVLNTIEDEYSVQDLGFFARELNLPLDLGGIQNLLLGNPIFPDKLKLEAEIEGGSYLLKGRREGWEWQYWFDGEGFFLTAMTVEDLSSGRWIELQLEDQRQKEGDERIFSYLRYILLNDPQNGQISISIDFSKIVFDEPKDIAFDIPASYTRVQP